MRVSISSEIDCEGAPVSVSVQADVPSGMDVLDLALYDAMATACRLLAKAARDDQLRMHAERAQV